MTTALQYARLKSNGICGTCKSRKALPGITYCAICITKLAPKRASWYQRNRDSQIIKSANEREKRKAENRCVKCGQALDNEYDHG